MGPCRRIFAPTRHFSLPRKLVDRRTYIVQRCIDKRVLHVGFADYASLGEWSAVVETRHWLHSQIQKVAREVVGVDNSEKAVHLLRSKYGMASIFVADAQHLDRLGITGFDVIVAGELLEHLPCPGAFLSSARDLLNPGGSVLVTTTNAFCVRRFLRIPFGKESIHVDHVAYFSHRTLQRLAEVCGYHIIEQCSYRIPNKSPLLPYLVEYFASLVSPNLCEGIICNMNPLGA